MSTNHSVELIQFLKSFDKDKSKLFLWLREHIWSRYPEANELIGDHVHQLVCKWSPTDRPNQSFCSISINRKSQVIRLGFTEGSKLKDPEEILIGEGKRYRYVLIRNQHVIPLKYIDELLSRAYKKALRSVGQASGRKEA